jgi:hypothetical protein
MSLSLWTIKMLRTDILRMMTVLNYYDVQGPEGKKNKHFQTLNNNKSNFSFGLLPLPVNFPAVCGKECSYDSHSCNFDVNRKKVHQ